MRARLAWCAALAFVGIGLFACYLLQARTYAVTSDGAANALQAWGMLHGHLLLHGWWLSDVSFYTTELPEYVLVEAIAGLRPEVVDISAALTYTFLVLLVAMVGRGHARGREGVLRALLAGGIMAAPGLGYGTYAVLSAPDHTGTGVPIMVILLLLDRLDPPDRPRACWYLPPLLMVLLVWVQVADTLATLAAAIPIALVGAIRAGRYLLRRGSGPAKRVWQDLLLSAAAVASIPLAAVTLGVLRASGGFYLHPLPGPLLASPAAWPGQARMLGQCVLTLFGADVIGQPLGVNYGLMLLHMAGVAVVALALLAGIGRFFSRMDRISQILVLSVIGVLGAAEFSTQMTNIFSVREIATVLPVAAALAGRVVGGASLGRASLGRARLGRARLGRVLTAALGVGLAGYLAALGYAAAQPAAPAENQALADWLRAHGLVEGLAGYWQADSVTLDSGGKVVIAPIFGASPYRWESESSWYDPAVSHPDFVVTVSSPPDEEMFARPVVIHRVFGRPAQVYRYGRYTIMVWKKNLLTDLGTPPPLPPAATIAARATSTGIDGAIDAAPDGQSGHAPGWMAPFISLRVRPLTPDRRSP
ncbi:MAG TPA: hypothetical protein VF070_17370 [Streptosporangiaceae bacterium]